MIAKTLRRLSVGGFYVDDNDDIWYSFAICDEVVYLLLGKNPHKIKLQISKVRKPKFTLVRLTKHECSIKGERFDLLREHSNLIKQMKIKDRGYIRLQEVKEKKPQKKSI